VLDVEVQTHRTVNAEETRALGQALGQLARPGDYIACCGALGAGKTTFVQGFAEGLGVGADDYVSSPTFTLMQLYRGRLPLCHCDFYRLMHDDDVWNMGFEDYLDIGGVTIVEWADKFPSVLPTARLDVYMKILAPELRCIELRISDSSHQHYLQLAH
jgi:tRNA threonylcarbamoyladenosine biosynthesis protein TsaE